jgi:hypothetical protein
MLSGFSVFVTQRNAGKIFATSTNGHDVCLLRRRTYCDFGLRRLSRPGCCPSFLCMSSSYQIVQRKQG